MSLGPASQIEEGLHAGEDGGDHADSAARHRETDVVPS
jgi:hypothetical protein